MTSRPGNEHDHSHDQWDELAVGYALTALEPDEIERFIEHLVSFCPQCQRSVDDTAAIGAELGGALPLPIAPPSADLRSQVLGAAFAARPAVPQTTADLGTLRAEDGPSAASAAPAESGPSVAATPAATTPVGTGAHRVVDLAESRRARALRPTAWLVAAAAAVVAAVLAVTTVVATNGRNHAQTLSADRESALSQFFSAASMVVPLQDTAGKTVASVIARPTSVSVVSSTIAPNPSSSIYVLWGLAASAGTPPTALGGFDVNGHAIQSAQVGSDSRGKYTAFAKFAVSEEPGHTPPASPTKIIATGAA